MKPYLKQIAFALSAVFILVMIWAFPAAAQTVTFDEVPRNADGEPDCRSCHWETFLDWEHSIHGQGLSCGQCHLSDPQDHARQGHGALGGPEDCMSCHTTGYDAETDTWVEDNIHCKACHTPLEIEHPDKPMPTNRSSELCGSCHIQAFFEWQESEHRNSEVTCIDCHSQHTTALRFVDANRTCAKCHESRVEEFMHSGHMAAGVDCASCHLAPLGGPIGSGSAKLNHTFIVELDTCTECHLEELHAGKQVSPKEALLLEEPGAGGGVAGGAVDDDHASGTPLKPDAMASSTLVGVSRLPRGANLLQFAAFFALVAFGVAIIRRPSLLNWLPLWGKKEAVNE